MSKRRSRLSQPHSHPTGGANWDFPDSTAVDRARYLTQGSRPELDLMVAKGLKLLASQDYARASACLLEARVYYPFAVRSNLLYALAAWLFATENRCLDAKVHRDIDQSLRQVFLTIQKRVGVSRRDVKYVNQVCRPHPEFLKLVNASAVSVIGTQVDSEL